MERLRDLNSRLLLVLILCILTVVMTKGQTRIKPDNIEVTGDARVLIVANGKIEFAMLGNGIGISKVNEQYIICAATQGMNK